MALLLCVTFALVVLSLLGQRLAGRLLGVELPIRPLLPFAKGTTARQQVLVRLGGVLFTWVLLFATAGVQFSREAEWSTRVEVVDGLAASKAGLRSGDVVVRVGAAEVRDFSELKDRLGFGGLAKTLVVRRDGVELSFEVHDWVLGLKRSDERVSEENRSAAWGRAATLFVRVLPLLGGELPDGVVFLLITAALAWWGSVVLEVLAFGVNAAAAR